MRFSKRICGSCWSNLHFSIENNSSHQFGAGPLTTDSDNFCSVESQSENEKNDLVQVVKKYGVKRTL